MLHLRVSYFNLPKFSLQSMTCNVFDAARTGTQSIAAHLQRGQGEGDGHAALHAFRRFALSSAALFLAPIALNAILLLSFATNSCEAQAKANSEASHPDTTALQSQVPAAQPTYSVAELSPVAVQTGVIIPGAYVDGMGVRIAHALEDSKRFTQVVQSSDSSAAPSVATLRINCTVIKFVPGNRAERALFPGAGATKITVHVAFNDAQSGKILLEQNVKGLIWYGAAAKGFGNPNSAQKDVAKNIENIVTKHF